MYLKLQPLNVCIKSNFLKPYQKQLKLIAAQSTAAIHAKENVIDKSYNEQLQSEWELGKPFNEIPGPTRFQIWRAFMRGGEFEHVSLDKMMLKCRERYGDTYLLPGLFGMPSNVMTFSIDSFEKIFRTEGQWPVRSGMDPIIFYRESRKDQFFKDSLGLMSNGEEWARQRHAANPVLMQHRNAALYLKPMQAVSKQFIERIREIRDPATCEVPDNFLDIINHLTFESIAVVALDRQFGLLKNSAKSPESEKLFKNIEVFLKSFYDLGVKPSLYKYIPTPTYKRFKLAMDEIFDTCQAYINEALERIEHKPKDAAERSVLEKLINIDRKFAIVMSMDMLMGGIDTSSSAMSGIILNLAKNPVKQAKLREEILNILPHPNEEFTIESMKTLPYLRACIKESLRLYPITFGNMRETGADLVLGGYQIPKSTRVFMNSNLLLKDESYFPRADEFIPERWLRSIEDKTNLIYSDSSPFLYLPFGFGPRMCAGKRIIDIELELAISNLVRNFEFEYNYPTENAFMCQFIFKPAIPLKFKFKDLKTN